MTQRQTGPISQSAEVLLPWLIDIDVFQSGKSSTFGAQITVDTTSLYNGYNAATAQNQQRTWDVPLAAGTWTLESLHYTGTDQGITTWTFGGISIGTIDHYSSPAVQNVRASLAFSVPYAGIYELKVVMATKNASSSNYKARIQHVQLRCTARYDGGGAILHRIARGRSARRWPQDLAPDWIEPDVYMTAQTQVNFDQNTTSSVLSQKSA